MENTMNMNKLFEEILKEAEDWEVERDELMNNPDPDVYEDGKKWGENAKSCGVIPRTARRNANFLVINAKGAMSASGLGREDMYVWLEGFLSVFGLKRM
jgi:hypothetical protein